MVSVQEKQINKTIPINATIIHGSSAVILAQHTLGSMIYTGTAETEFTVKLRATSKNSYKDSYHLYTVFKTDNTYVELSLFKEETRETTNPLGQFVSSVVDFNYYVNSNIFYMTITPGAILDVIVKGIVIVNEKSGANWF